MRVLLSVACSFLVVSTGLAQTEAKPFDVWEAVYSRDKQNREQLVGYSHIIAETILTNSKPIIRTTRDLSINVKREGTRAQLRITEGTDETLDGKVIGVTMTSWNGREVMWKVNGTVDGKEMLITQDGLKKGSRKIGWDPEIISMAKEQTILADKKVKPGDAVNYKMYASTLSFPVTIRSRVEAEEEVALPLQKGKRKLIRVESEADEVQGAQLPGTTTWIDPKTLQVVMTQTELPGIGVITLLRTTKEVANGPLGNLPDIVALQSIRLGQRVEGNVHSLSGIVYKVAVRGKFEPAKLIKEDARQEIKEVDLKTKTFELHIEAKRSPPKTLKFPPADPEFLRSNHFITSDDELVKKLALKAVGKEKDSWRQAQLIEKFVRSYITEVVFTQALDTAAQVAESRKGDCTEFSMLCAAMCRAVGIPSRTAIGLVYVDRTSFSETPVLAFHMWTEVYVNGQWLGLDATLAQGSIGPGHLKITDHSWDKVDSMLPLLPVQSFIQARPTIEIKGATRD